MNLLRGLAPLAPQTRGSRAARKLAQIVAAKSSPACPGLTPSPQLPRIGSPSRKRRTEDGAPLTGRDDSQGRRGALLAPGALPRGRARGRSVTSLSSVWCRAACRSKDLISKVGGVDSKDSSDLGFYYLFYKF